MLGNFLMYSLPICHVFICFECWLDYLKTEIDAEPLTLCNNSSVMTVTHN